MAQLRYGDMEARRQLADVDHDFPIQGEGFGVLSDDQNRSPNPPPSRNSEAPLQVHHQRKDAISGSDSSSPLAVPSSYGVRPVTSGYGNLDLKPEEAGRAPPAEGSDEGRFDRSGLPNEESMAKELQDQSAARGGLVDVHDMKDNYADLSEGSTDKQRREDDSTYLGTVQSTSAPVEGIRDVHNLKDNYVDLSKGSTDQQQKEDESTTAAATHDETTQFPPKSDAGEGITDVHNLKDNFVDLSEGNDIQQQSEGNLTNATPRHEETAQLTSQIKSPADEPKQEHISRIDAPIVNPEQEPNAGLMLDDSKPVPRSDNADLEQQQRDVRTDDSLKEVPRSDNADLEQQQRKVQPDDSLKEELAQPCSESHGCPTFEGEDGRKKLNVEGYNIYSGELENVVYDATDVMNGQPESLVSEKDDKLEDKAFDKDEWDLQVGEAPENLVEDPSYVMGGRPESGIVVKEDGGSGVQEVEQEKLAPVEGAGMRDIQEDVDVKLGGPHTGDRDFHALQEEKPTLEDKTFIADSKSDVKEHGPESGIVVEEDGRRDLQEVEQEKVAPKEGADLRDMRDDADVKLDGPNALDADIHDLKEEQPPLTDQTFITEEGGRDVQEAEQKKVAPGEGVDLRDMREDADVKLDGPNTLDADMHDLKEDQPPFADEAFIADIKGDVKEEEEGRDVQEAEQEKVTPVKGADFREDVDVKLDGPNALDAGMHDMKEVQPPLADETTFIADIKGDVKEEEGRDVQEAEQEKVAPVEGADTRGIREDVDVKLDGPNALDAGMHDLKEEQPPLADETTFIADIKGDVKEGGRDVQEAEQEKVAPVEGADACDIREDVDVKLDGPNARDAGMHDLKEEQPPLADETTFIADIKGDVKEEGRDVQEVEQEKVPPVEGADTRDIREDVDGKLDGPNALDAGMHDLKDEQPPLADETTFIADIKGDVKEVPEGRDVQEAEQEKVAPVEGADTRDIREDVDVKLDGPNALDAGMRDLKEEQPPLADETTFIADIKGDVKEEGRDVQEAEQEKIAPVEGEDTRDIGEDGDVKLDGPNALVADMHNLKEEQTPLADETFIADIKGDVKEEGRDVQDGKQEKVVPEEGADMRDMSEDANVKLDGPNAGDADMHDLQEEEPAFEDKTSIADIKSDGQTGMQQVRNPERPPNIDEGTQMEGTVETKPYSARDGSVEDQTKEPAEVGGIAFLDKEREEGPVHTKPADSPHDVSGEDQIKPYSPREGSVEDQTKEPAEVGGIAFLDKEREEGPVHTKPEDLPRDVSGEDQIKESGETRGIAFVEENQKDTAQAGEQFLLNSPVVDYNKDSLPTEQAGELRVDSGKNMGSSLESDDKVSTDSPYTVFDGSGDYVKTGYGAEGFVPQKNEEVDRQLREAVGEEQKRRMTVEHPLSLQQAAQGTKDSDVAGMDAIGSRPGYSDKGGIREGVNVNASDYDYNAGAAQASMESARPPTMPHPQPNDLAGIVNNNKNNNEKDTVNEHPQPRAEQEEHENHPDQAAPHKKGVFERIKEKLTPHHHNGST
ncbi:hypothetical protein L7F22_034133 [Adiantum nelumboides]|nr:hypothetical protein [Adiantum nelumboides]